MGKIIMRLNFLKSSMSIFFTFFFLFINLFVYGQIKNKAFFEIGSGFQFSKSKIEGAKLTSLVQSPNPKLFLGFGIELNLKTRLNLCLSINANPSKTETYTSYYNDTDQMNFTENLLHKDINYGISVGLKYKAKNNKRLSFGMGINFQKLSVEYLYSDFYFWGGTDTALKQIIHVYNSNNFSKLYTSWICYLNVAYAFGKQKKSELIFEFNSTINRPIFGYTELYYNQQLVEKSKYQINQMFMVLKFRQKF